jgi:hypothetical protein
MTLGLVRAGISQLFCIVRVMVYRLQVRRALVMVDILASVLL